MKNSSKKLFLAITITALAYHNSHASKEIKIKIATTCKSEDTAKKDSSIIQKDLLSPYQLFQKSSPIFLTNDSLIYDLMIGETYQHYTLANGWRSDTINGGSNKTAYRNPYTNYNNELRFIKKKNQTHYRYQEGRIFTGSFADTLNISFSDNKIKGYLYGKPYYESINTKVILRATCKNGLIEGRAVLCVLVPQYGIYDNLRVSEANFKSGALIGECKYWDLRSIDFKIKSDGTIHCYSHHKDYFEMQNNLKIYRYKFVNDLK